MNNKINNKKYNTKKSSSLHKTKKTSSKTKKKIEIKHKNTDNDISNKVFTYGIGSSIIKLNKNKVTIYTNINFKEDKIHDVYFINNFDINQINRESNKKWTTTTYTYSGSIFMMSRIFKQQTHSSKIINYLYNQFLEKEYELNYNEYHYPNFNTKENYLGYILIHLSNNHYLSISSYVIEEFQMPENDKIISVKEDHPKRYVQDIFLRGHKYSYYISISPILGYTDGKSFYISNEDFTKYNMDGIFHNNDVSYDLERKSWSFIYFVKIPIQTKILGVTTHKYNYEPLTVYDVIHELKPIVSIKNHNSLY